LARNPANYEDVAREINSEGGKAIGVSADLSEAKSVQAAFKQINDMFGSIPLAAAVFNLGGGFVKRPFLELTEAEFEQGFITHGYVVRKSYITTEEE
jgi:NAD(P)-dependent dehydrogenase (short-subunit alcohol dehydrogenase family)